jgi:cell shape-determining protein MreC
MIHQFRDKKQTQHRRLLAQGLIFLGVFLFLSVGVILSFGSKTLHTIARPIWTVRNSFINGVDSVGALMRSKTSLEKENERLQTENTNLNMSMLDYKILKDENEHLKQLMGRQPTAHSFILAQILSKPDRSPYDTLVVDVGSSGGAKVGQTVYANGSIQIGTISIVYANTSLVSLYSNPGHSVQAMIDGSNSSVELVGRGGGNFEMKIPEDLPSNKGTLVVLPNTRSVRSEVVAIVEEVLSTPGEPYKKVLLRSPVNIWELKWVQIEK